MSKIESSQAARELRDDELDTVNGGFGFVERSIDIVEGKGTIGSDSWVPPRNPMFERP